MSPFTNRQPSHVEVSIPNKLFVEFTLGGADDPLRDREAVSNEITKYVQAYPTIKQVSTQYTDTKLQFFIIGSLNLSRTNPFI